MNRIIFLRSSWCDCRNCINCIDNKTFEIRDGKLGFNLVEELVDRNNLCNFIVLIHNPPFYDAVKKKRIESII